jgi:hypothetical protein
MVAAASNTTPRPSWTLVAPTLTVASMAGGFTAFYASGAFPHSPLVGFDAVFDTGVFFGAFLLGTLLVMSLAAPWVGHRMRLIGTSLLLSVGYTLWIEAIHALKETFYSTAGVPLWFMPAAFVALAGFVALVHVLAVSFPRFTPQRRLDHGVLYSASFMLALAAAVSLLR